MTEKVVCHLAGPIWQLELDELLRHSVQHDNQGRVDKVTQGTRELKLDYASASGFLTKVTQSNTATSDTRVIEYKQHDGVGRPWTVTLPGAHDLGLQYDANGNMTSVTPPTRKVRAQPRVHRRRPAVEAHVAGRHGVDRVGL